MAETVKHTRARRGERKRFIHEVAMHHTGDDCLTWPFSRTKAGYCKISIGRQEILAHRYVCELAHGAPPTTKHQAAHSCGKGHCLSPWHLSWKTQSENEADKLAHGTHNRGERHVSAKLTEAAAREIIALKGLERKNKLAKRFGVSATTIGDIQAGSKWAWLSKEVTA
jgi:hypothetical protein